MTLFSAKENEGKAIYKGGRHYASRLLRLIRDCSYCAAYNTEIFTRI